MDGDFSVSSMNFEGDLGHIGPFNFQTNPKSSLLDQFDDGFDNLA